MAPVLLVFAFAPSTQAQTPPWSASWIRLPGSKDRTNVYWTARKAFELAEPPVRATLRITAGTFYDASLNGKRLGRGPSPSYPKWQYFDTYDATSGLAAGRNVLAVLVHSHGEKMPETLGQFHDPPGLLAQIEIEGRDGKRTVLGTGADWKIREDPARDTTASEILVGHRGFYKEVWDAAKEARGWREAAFDDAAWGAPEVPGPAIGTAPWENLIPRDIPFLESETVHPVNCFFVTEGSAYMHGGNPQMKKHEVEHPQALTRSALRRAESAEETPGIEASQKGGGEVAVFHPEKNRMPLIAVLEFPRNLTGYFTLDIADAKGGEVEIAYGESLDMTWCDRVKLRPGAQTYSPFDRRAGKYVMLAFRDCPGPVAIRSASFEQVAYPAPDAGSFRCSDERLNRIWEVGKYTVRACRQDQYEDCPWREQTLYAGDLRMSSLIAYYAFGDAKLTAKGLRQLARIQKPDGEIPAAGPAPGYPPVIPEYPAWWLISLDEHYLHHGDLALVKELWPNVLRCLAWYDGLTNERGLLGNLMRPGWWVFLDNECGVEKKDQVTAVQMIYHKALLGAARLAKAAGDEKTAGEAEAKAKAIRGRINTLLWDEQENAYIDSLDGTTPVRKFSKVTNALAVTCGVAAGERRRDVAALLKDHLRAVEGKGPFMNLQVAQAVMESGDVDWAVRYIRDYWGGMLDRGASTFWEIFDPTMPGFPPRMWSQCHGYSAGPTWLLPAYVAGIRPIRPGYEKVLIHPRLTRDVTCSTRVPIPHGMIGVDVDEKWMVIELPKGVQATVKQDCHQCNDPESEIGPGTHRISRHRHFK